MRGILVGLFFGGGIIQHGAGDIGAYAVLWQRSTQKPSGSNLTTGLPVDGPTLKNGAGELVPKCADYEISAQDPIMRSVSPRAKIKLAPTEPRKIARNTSSSTILKAYQSAEPERSNPNHILLNILTWLLRMNLEP